MIITEEQRTQLRAALLSPDLHISAGLGYADTPGTGMACTIAEINLVLTGKVSDDSHPCMSEAIRDWVIHIQDAMPDKIRNSAAWREAAVGIAGSAAGAKAEQQRVALLLNWMWDALADDQVIASIPVFALSAWRTMLAERTADAARVAAESVDPRPYALYAIRATYAARAVTRATYAARAVTRATYAARTVACVAYAARAVACVARFDDYWQRRDVPGMLRTLIEVTV